MNMYQMLKDENAVSATEKAFAAYVRRVVAFLGCDELSERVINGGVWDMFRDDNTAEDTASELKALGAVLIHTNATGLYTEYKDGSSVVIDLVGKVVEAHPKNLFRVYSRVAGVPMREYQVESCNLVAAHIIR